MKFVFYIFLALALTAPVNAEILQGGVVHENGKTVTPFYFNGKINSWGVQYDDDMYHNYYYDMRGNLIQYDVLDKPRNQFPHTTISYDAENRIISKSTSISKTEQLVFYPNGKLKARWIGNECYDANGNKLASKRLLRRYAPHNDMYAR